MNRTQALATFRAHRPMLEARGVYLPDIISYVPDEFKTDFMLAMDEYPKLAMDAGLPPVTAQSSLTTTASAGIPTMLTTLIDPQVFEVLFAPNRAADIIGEVRKGSWTDQTAMFPIVEHVGEVSSYGDFAEGGGRVNMNANWPNRQSYLFQTFKEWGELETARYALGKISYAAELDKAVATILNKFLNASYFFGIAGLQNYGLINDPSFAAALTPATKSYGGVKWVNNGVIQATANEIVIDIQSMVFQLIKQTGSLVNSDSEMTLALSPESEFGLTATNSFNVNVKDILKKILPKLKVESAVQYGVVSAQNNQGNAAGNLAQLIATKIEGQEAGYASFNEKMRAHRIVPASSSLKQKLTAGTWGTIVRMPVAFVSMVGM